MFADDTIVFCGADRMQLGNLRCTLLGFEAVSGLKVNLQKTEIIPIGVQENMSDLAVILNCKIDSLPSTYLGMPLGAKFKCKEVWESILEKCKKRLSDWKLNYLSSGARVTLIKSVLSSLPTYYLSLFSAPASVLKELEKMQRDFLWGKHEKPTKCSLVAWEKVCASFKSGGVGIRKLALQNEALLGKWLWRFSNEDSSLWKRMIVSKYGVEVGGWISSQSSQPYGVSLWKGIRKIWPKFEGCISWQLGCGDRIRFWKHRWLDIGCLADVFPDIFSIAVDKDALVSDYHSSFGQNGGWNIQLRRHVNDWELGNFCHLLELLNSVVCVNISDTLIWKETRDNIFNVGSFYNVLKGDVVDPFPWRKIWRSVAPHRVIFFAWCVIHGKVLTIDNLKRRGHVMVNRCPLCHGNEESIDHLFIHCPWTTGVWSFVLACFGVQTCTPKDIKSFLLQWWGQRLAKRQKEVWNLVPLCLFWIVWKERNKRIFEGEGNHAANVKGRLFKVLLSWVNVGKDTDLFSLLFFIESLGSKIV